MCHPVCRIAEHHNQRWARKKGCAMSSMMYERARWFDGYTDDYGNLI